MNVADKSSRVHDAVERHAPQLKKVDFLPVQQRKFMLGVRQANEGNRFIAPVLLKGRRRIRTDRQDLNATVSKAIISISQTRQLRAAIRSRKTSQERQQHRSAAKLRQAHAPSFDILRFKIGRRVSRCDELAHAWMHFWDHWLHCIITQNLAV